MGLLCRISKRQEVRTPSSTSTPTRDKMVEMKGTYERSAAENYEAFLDALGVGMILKKAATATTPVMTVTEEGGQWTIKTSTMLKSMELKFKLGEEFDEKTPDGREVTSIVTQEGDKLIQADCQEGQRSLHRLNQGVLRRQVRTSHRDCRQGRGLHSDLHQKVNLDLMFRHKATKTIFHIFMLFKNYDQKHPDALSLKAFHTVKTSFAMSKWKIYP